MKREIALSLMCFALVSIAAPKTKSKKPVTVSPVVPKAAAKLPPPLPVPAPKRVQFNIPAAEAPKATLARLNQLYNDLEYESVLSGVEQMLKRDDLAIGDRLEFWRLQGCAKAVAEDSIEAEKPFRLLLRARDDFELPSSTPPKIMAVFRKVQLEENALTKQLKEVARERTVAQLKLLGAAPTEAVGGRALSFTFRLIDATQAVSTIRVPYRKLLPSQQVSDASKGADYSALALERSETGDWKGVIPGDVTANEGGFKLQYYVETADSAGPLLRMGSAELPQEILVSAGQVPKRRFAPIGKGVFFTGVGLTVALGLAAGGLGAAFNINQNEYRQLGSSSGTIDGARLAALGDTTKTYALFTNVALISAGVALVATAIMLPLTNLSDE
jgi:hypothetical protein